MWEAIKDEVKFKHFIFSRYKEYYSIDVVVGSFPKDKFIAIALPYGYLDGYYKRNIPYFKELGYSILMFGIDSDEGVLGAIELGANAVYVDTPTMLPEE